MILKTSKRIQALPPYFFDGLNKRIAQLRSEGKDVIRMDMGSPDLPPAPFIVEAMKKAADDSTNHGYQPFGGIPAYREAWAHFYGKRFGVELDPKTELAGLLGSKEGIFNLSLAFVDQGDVVLVPDPGYAPYTAGALFAGGEVVTMPLLAQNNFLPDLKSISPEVLKRVKLMWLNYPNNPTGAVAPLEFFAEVIALGRQYNFLVAHDAPYTEIVFDGYSAPSILQLPQAKEVCVEFSSCSKTYNMGGWRLGVVCGNAQAVNALGTLKSNIDSGHFKPLMDAASLALSGDQSWIVERNATYRARRDIVVSALRDAGMKVDVPAAAIYVWAKLPDGVDDETYAAHLLGTVNVSVTPGAVFGAAGKGYIRISLGTPTERVREAMGRIQLSVNSEQ
ncbi:MAG: aminotransferase class I/II-fold pyridoxal phosphate-dependent enzyme [Chloroflexi bacterium]|nr:aminotransferase class I/II-fold pyridoxal phosphate-dependent enzyme [Chloroflexota bacterium]